VTEVILNEVEGFGMGQNTQMSFRKNLETEFAQPVSGIITAIS